MNKFRFTLLLFLLTFLSQTLTSFGQDKNPNHQEKPVIPHQVSGVVLDSLGSPLVAAIILLKSSQDSITVQTNGDGVFVIEQLKEASFSIRVSHPGYNTRIGKYLFNENTRVIVLDPILLSNQSHELKEVVINGTPTIKYKKDTVEYRASDYKVQQYANVSELLKQMEGMEVGPDGKLFFHGEEVKTAKLNGKEFSGGDVKNALESLPAEIVEKIQIINDFGELAAKTGIKNKASKKTLNVTTQADKSIASIGLLKAQDGTSGRFNEQASIENINGNRVLAVNENLKRTIAGVNATDGTNTTFSTPDYADVARPGKTTVAATGVSYTNDSGNGLSYVGSYNFLYDKNQLNSQTTSQLYSTLGSTFSTANNNNEQDLKVHQVQTKINYELSKFDFVQFLTDFVYSNQVGSEKSQSENSSNFSSGQQHFNTTIQDLLNKDKSNIKLTGLYVRSFKKTKRFFSAQLSFNPATENQTDNKATNYRYYADSLNSSMFVDSSSHLVSRKIVKAKTSEITLIYGEPLKPNGLLEFYFDVRNTAYSNSASTDTIYQDGRSQELYRLRNNFDYNFTEGKVSVDYHYTLANTELVLGAAPYWTDIKRPAISTQNQLNINNSTFVMLPVFSYMHAWSKMERISFEYNEATTEPTAQQLQPYTDNTDPNNIIIGNPTIKPTFIHTLSASYNKYLPNELINISVSAFYRLFQHDITTTLIQQIVPISGGLNKTTNEITFLNIEGDQNTGTRYSLSKQLSQNLIKLELDGDISYFYRQAYSNLIKYSSTQWHFSNKLGTRINFDKKAGINPYIGYIVDQAVADTHNAIPSTTRTLIAAVSGFYNLPYDFQIHSSAMKNYLNGFGTYNSNPFVVNAGLERRLLERHNLMLTLNIFDIFNQSNFVQQMVTPESTVYTKSNISNRYLLVGLQYNFQKWGGAPVRNGVKMKRKGDGSFY